MRLWMLIQTLHRVDDEEAGRPRKSWVGSIHHHRAAEKGIHHAAPATTVVFQRLVEGPVLDRGVDFLGVEDLLVALELGVPADEQEVLLRIGQHEQGLPLAGDLGDVSLTERLNLRNLRRGGWRHGAETGFAEEVLLLLQMGGAGPQANGQQGKGKK